MEVNAMRVLALLALALVLAAPSEAGHATGAAAEIEALDNKFITAFNKEDVETIVTLYAKDATAMLPGPELWVSGTDAIRKAFMDFFADCDSPNLTIHHTQYKVSGNLGYGIGLFDLAYKDAKTGTMMTSKGRACSVFEKRDGKWVYVVDHASIPMPPPPDAGTAADPASTPVK
jgi:uncharacterized protein (TIGR02246 family)